jgi:hypothetical protein
MNIGLRILVAGMVGMTMAAALSTGGSASPDKPVIGCCQSNFLIGSG